MTPRERAEQLRAQGVTETRGVRTLLHEFPTLERVEALAAWGHIPEVGWWATSMFSRPFAPSGIGQEDWQAMQNPNPGGRKTDRDYDRESRKGA